MPRGFASLSPERRKEMAKRGAARLHKSNRAHKFTSEEAREAAKKRHSMELFPSSTRLINTEPLTHTPTETPPIATNQHTP